MILSDLLSSAEAGFLSSTEAGFAKAGNRVPFRIIRLSGWLGARLMTEGISALEERAGPAGGAPPGPAPVARGGGRGRARGRPVPRGRKGSIPFGPPPP